MSALSRRLVLAGSAALLLIAVFLVATRVASQKLQAELLKALGPRASVGEVTTGWRGIEARELRVRAAAGWPAEDELRATRVHVVPDLRSLFGGPWRVARITVEDGYVSALRGRDGRLRIVPALLGDAQRGQGTDKGTQPSDTPPSTVLVIGNVELRNATLAFFDASVRTPAHAMRLEKLQADVGPLKLPSLDEAVRIDIKGAFKGPQRDGTLSIEGDYTPANHDAELKLALRGVDLVALQPYLVKVSEGGVRRGALDMDATATVQKERLHAPGKLTLVGLELNSGGGMLSTFAGVPRKAVLAAMSDKGRIDIRFTLEGRVTDPSFSLNEAFATRIASGLAESLGVSVQGVVRGVEGLVKGLFGK